MPRSPQSDKDKRGKNKVAFGKKVTLKSPVHREKSKTKSKAVDAIDVDKMLEMYKKETANKGNQATSPSLAMTAQR